MATRSHSLRRRSLQPINGPTLVEGVMTRCSNNDYVTIEVAGGPPATTVTVLVGGAAYDRIQLDAAGAGSLQVPSAPGEPWLEIAVEEQVLLTGRVPAAPAQLGGTP